MAGHDVLAITLRAVFYYLSKHPSVRSQLRQELQAKGKNYTLSDPLPYAKLEQCPYL